MSLNVAYPVLAATQSCLWMAEATGAFAKHGVQVNTKLIKSSLAIDALIAGGVDVDMQSATPLIAADLNGKANLVYVAGISDHPQGSLSVKPEIKTPDDLKGKLLGSDKAGSTTDYYTQLELKLMGIQPSDVTIRPIGSSDIILQALLSGQIDGGTITPPHTFAAEAKGYPTIQTTYKTDYQGNGVMVHRDRIPELKPALLAYLAGMREGIKAFNTQPDLAKQVMAKYAKITDPDVLEKTYQFHQTSNPFQKDMKPTLKGIQAMMDFLEPTIPAVKDAKPEQFVDLSLLNELPSE
jgi:ABC-type nitrate/sulfonate/bicarbonate transport system substrate-binding protein